MATQNLADLKCKSTIYLTPEAGLRPVRSYFEGPIPLDPATEPSNPTGALAFGIDPQGPQPSLGTLGTCYGSGLLIPWHQHAGVFVNPPYGKGMKNWCQKIYEEAVLGATIIALLPAGARFATRYFQNYILTPKLGAACFVRGRMKFLRPDGTPTTGSNPYDSVYYLLNGDVPRFIECFKPLGSTMKIEVAA